MTIISLEKGGYFLIYLRFVYQRLLFTSSTLLLYYDRIRIQFKYIITYEYHITCIHLIHLHTYLHITFILYNSFSKVFFQRMNLWVINGEAFIILIHSRRIITCLNHDRSTFTINDTPIFRQLKGFSNIILWKIFELKKLFSFLLTRHT